MPQPVGQSIAYMRREGYSVAQVRQIDLGTIRVSGTPTLLLVDQKGHLEKQWVGELGPSGENEVADALGIGKIVEQQPPVLLAGMIPSANALSASIGRTSPAAHRQDDEQSTGTKTVRMDHPTHDDPVVVEEILDGNTDVTPRGRNPITGAPYKSWIGKPFEANGDWIKHLVVIVKNVLSKDIIAGSIELYIPETPDNSTHHRIAHQAIGLGQTPESALYTLDGRKINQPPARPLHIGPDQRMKFVFAPIFSLCSKSFKISGAP